MEMSYPGLMNAVFSIHEYLELLRAQNRSFTNRTIRLDWTESIRCLAGISGAPGVNILCSHPELVDEYLIKNNFRVSPLAQEWMIRSSGYKKALNEYNRYLEILHLQKNPENAKICLSLAYCRVVDFYTLFWTRRVFDPEDQLLRSLELMENCSDGCYSQLNLSAGSVVHLENTRILWVWDSVHQISGEEYEYHADLVLQNMQARIGEMHIYRATIEEIHTNQNVLGTYCSGHILSGKGLVSSFINTLPDPDILPGRYIPFIEGFRCTDYRPTW